MTGQYLFYVWHYTTFHKRKKTETYDYYEFYRNKISNDDLNKEK